MTCLLSRLCILATTFLVFNLFLFSESRALTVDEGVAAYREGKYKEAVRTWNFYAKSTNSAIAKYNLALAYERGHGVEQDFYSSTQLFKAAAEQGYADAQNALALAYQNGIGIKKDIAAAYVWFYVAEVAGSEHAKKNIAAVRSLLNTAELTKAQKLARQKVKTFSTSVQLQGQADTKTPQSETNVACEKTSSQSAVCDLGLTRSRLVGTFSSIKNAKAFDFGSTDSKVKYEWSIELGQCEASKFKGDNFRIVATIDGKNKGNKISVAESLKDTAKILELPKSGVVYSSTKNAAANDNAGVYVNQLDNDEIAVQAFGPRVISAFSRLPSKLTHGRMVARLPAAEESYECIVRIQTLDLP